MAGVDTEITRVVAWERLQVITDCGNRPKPATQRRALIWRVGPSTSWGVHNNSLRNGLRAVRERVFAVEANGQLRKRPQSSPGAFELLADFKSRLLVAMPFPPLKLSSQQFCESYHGAKRAMYERAVESLSRRPIERSDASGNAFVKGEKVEFTTQKPDPAPRVIQPRNPRYNVELGRFLKPIEKAVYIAIAEVWGGPTVFKGMNCFEQGAALAEIWDEYEDPVAVGCDASRFDQHVGPPALRWEASSYVAIYRGNPHLAKLLSWQLRNKMYLHTPEGTIKYEVDGCRMSGDMNTSLGNCLLMCGMGYAAVTAAGIKCRLVNNGDDCQFIMPRKDVRRFLEAAEPLFVKFGFTIKWEDPVDRLEDIEFCQTRPFYDGARWRMVRTVRRAIAKDLMMMSPPKEGLNKAYREWLGAVGRCGLALCSGVPVMQALYCRMIALGEGRQVVAESGMAMLARGLNSEVSEITPEARLSMWRQTAILPSAQEELERLFSNISIGPLEFGTTASSSYITGILREILNGQDTWCETKW